MSSQRKTQMKIQRYKLSLEGSAREVVYSLDCK